MKINKQSSTNGNQKGNVGKATNQTADTKSTDLLAPDSLERQPEKNYDLNAITSDGTSVQEFVFDLNENYSQEILSDIKDTCDLDKLRALESEPDGYLREARKQINALLKGIHGLIAHTAMFTALSLILIGVILREIKGTFEKPHMFAQWRDLTFGIRHKRLLQQAIQLESMGNFSRKYSPLGKDRLLQLERIRKDEDLKSCEDLFRECSVMDEISSSALPDEVVENLDIEPFPDISYDIDNDQVKTYVNGVITFKRLHGLGLKFVGFDHAKYIAEYYQQAIPVKEAESIKNHLDTFAEEERPDAFDSIVMDGMKTAMKELGLGKSGYSLTKLVADLNQFCTKNDIEDDTWIQKQKTLVNRDSVLKALDYLRLITEKMGFNVQTSDENVKEDDHETASIN